MIDRGEHEESASGVGEQGVPEAAGGTRGKRGWSFFALDFRIFCACLSSILLSFKLKIEFTWGAVRALTVTNRESVGVEYTLMFHGAFMSQQESCLRTACVRVNSAWCTS